MQATNSRLVLSPSDLNDYVECGHLTIRLDSEVDRIGKPTEQSAPDSRLEILILEGVCDDSMVRGA